MASTPLFSLDGRIAPVTGASGGLGFGMTEGPAGAGATVFLNGRRADTLETAARKLQDRGLKADIAPFEVAEPATARAPVETVVGRMGRLDVVVANAGYPAGRRFPTGRRRIGTSRCRGAGARASARGRPSDVRK